MKVHLIQNSAISFSVCLHDKYQKFDALLEKLNEKFIIKYQKEVSLFTIRHYNEDALQKIEKRGKVLLKQLNQDTVQIIIK